ncbi:hypothetical protein T4C_12587 [Trichinella pseudospiralis]|uniref:Uncharacterized protein n=3 Tax=Trichinella pseudospiralis TaxID=6337 RepID=A0A0V1K8G6_TRIPS|nr:hypothetical protein T4C_12587 [Trichinella pseudospiralis]
MRLASVIVAFGRLAIWITKKRKCENADDTKQIEDDTKQNCGMKTYALHTQIRKPVMNRNTHEEERRKVEKATSMERLGWIESFVGQLRLLVSCVRWSNSGTLDVEDTIY